MQETKEQTREEATTTNTATPASAERAPIKAPEGVANIRPTAVDDISSDDKNGVLGGFSAAFQKLRLKAVRLLPRFVVNNSSNILGAAHVGTEMMMFKSAMPAGTKLVQNPKNPINWIVQPIKTVFSETFYAARAENVGTLFKGNFFHNITERISNTEKAAERYRQRPEYQKQLALFKEGLGNAPKLGNPWQFRTTFAGLIAWSLSAVIPEKKESDDEIERMAIMRHTKPLSYVAERFKQAVWAPEWHKHKRQMIGLCYLMVGICSTIGSWRGRTTVDNVEKYSLNVSYLMTSAISFISALPLMFATDEQRGYGTFGAIMNGRIPFLYGSIKKKYKDVDPGRRMYTFSSISFQVENFLFALVGGFEKLPDGTIVDHTKVHEQARKKAQIIEAIEEGNKPHRNEADDVPTATVNNAAKAEIAMPERRAAMEQKTHTTA